VIRPPDGPPGSQGVPSAAAVRFVILILVLAVSTGAIFGYWWQLSQAALQARVQACLTGHAALPVAQFIQRVSDSAVGPVQTADCVRPAGPSLTAWSLAGVAAMAVVTLLLYSATPWWIRRGGARGRRRLRELSVADRDRLGHRLDELAARAGVPSPSWLADLGAPRPDGRAFGWPRHPQVWLSAPLVISGPEHPRFTAVVLHELAHLRNQDLRLTYLSIAARNAFCIVLPAGYVAALVVAGAGPSWPDLRTTAAVLFLIALVWLNIWSVSQSLELAANATAAVQARDLPGYSGFAARDDRGHGQPMAWWRRAREWSPTLATQRSVHRDPGLLFRPDSLAMFSAGIATAIVASEVTPACFAVVLSSGSGGLGGLLSLAGNRALLLMLVTYGPAALIAAAVVAALACTQAWRLEYQAQVAGTGVGFRQLGQLALPLAAGMMAGIPLSVDYAMAGTWGVFDTSAGRDLIVLAISATVLATVLLIAFRWASESAAAWFTTDRRGSRVVRAAAILTGTVTFSAPLFAWTLTYGLPLSMQARRGPSPGQQRLLGHWPAVAAIDAHFLPLGVWDIVPGSAFLAALACVFVAAGGPRPGLPGRHGMPFRRVLAAGLVAGAISVIASLALILLLRGTVGNHAVIRAGGWGLLYFTRVFQLLVATGGGLAAAWAACRAGRVAMSSGILAALIASALAAVFAPRLLVVARYGWDRVPINPRAIPVLYGDAGNLLGGKVVLAAVVLAVVASALPRRRVRNRRQAARPPHPATTGPLLAPLLTPELADPAPRANRAIPVAAVRLAVVLLLGATLVGLALSAYFYLTKGFTLL